MRRQRILTGAPVPHQIGLSVPHARPGQRFWPGNCPNLALILVLATCLFPGMADARAIGLQTSGIQFASTRIETAFPAGITFLSTVQSDGAPIVAATLLYWLRGEPTTTRIDLKIQSGNQVSLRYYLDTAAGAIPPGAVIACRWEVADASGNHKVSEETSASYDDGRFLWQQRVTDQAMVLWHDAPADVGETALAITKKSLESERRIFKTDLSGPVRVVLYNSHEEFFAWQAGTPRFVAGRAFPALRITVQETGEFGFQDESQDEWLQRVIPHELSRLYFYQATNGSTNAPRWLDEGLALYNEFAGHAEEERLLQSSILRRRLIPFSSIDATLDNADEEQVRLAQAQAYSAVKYFVYRYSPGRLAGLLKAYRNGMTHSEAFSAVLGSTPEAFVEDWQIWLGVPWVWRQTPAPLPTATVAPSPTAGSAPLIPSGPAAEAVIDATPSDPRLAGAPPVALLVAILTLALAVPVATAQGFPRHRPQKPPS